MDTKQSSNTIPNTRVICRGGMGMFLHFGYNLPLDEKLRLIKNAGFIATSLGGFDRINGDEPDMARKVGLQIDNIHAPFGGDKPNQLWQDCIDGEGYQNMLITCVEDCATHEIPTAVIHLEGFPDSAPVTEIGLKRIGKVVEAAERKNIKLAFENLNSLEHLDAIFERFSSPNVGFCYDSGHENLNQPQDCLELYGDRLFVLHINDNFGDGCDAHILPFDGTIDWNEKMRKLKQCKDVDYFTFETNRIGFAFNPEHEKSAMYNGVSAQEYLKLAYERAQKLLDM